MTPQEQQMIDGLIDRIRNTQVADKDTAAEQYIHQGLANCPDAIYVLAQTVLVQQYGLQQAQQQIQALQSQLQQQQQQPASGGSFLSHLFGSQPAQPPYQPVSAPQYTQPVYAQPVYAQPVAYAQPAGGGFMRSALQTAAGVAMGEMAFQSMESLFHGFGGGGNYGGYGGGRPEEIVNNYYGDSGERHESRDDSNFYNPDHDASRGFADTTPTADDAPVEDTSYDDSVADTSSFDDSGSSGGSDDGSF